MKRIQKGMKIIYPNFEFVKREDLAYKCPLISELKNQTLEQNEKTTRHFKRSKDLHDKTTLLKFYDDQIRNEGQVMLEVPSIYEKKEALNTGQFKEHMMTKFRDKITQNFNKCLDKLNAKISKYFMFLLLCTMMQN